jgi:hypothetical protein
MSFKLSIQDYRQHSFGDPHPPKVFEYFPTRQEAAAAHYNARTAEPDPLVLICVTEARARKVPVAERQADFGFLEVDAPARRLTP